MKHYIALPFFLLACQDTISTGNQCDEFVDYVCTCHDDNPEYDCNELSNIYSDPDSDQISECAYSLDEQKELDAESDLECEV